MGGDGGSQTNLAAMAHAWPPTASGSWLACVAAAEQEPARAARARSLEAVKGVVASWWGTPWWSWGPLVPFPRPFGRNFFFEKALNVKC